MNPPFDLIVIGSGVAGLSVALAAAPKRVAVITRGALGVDGSSQWAQGGIAAAMGTDDSAALHAHDTLSAGQQLNDRLAVARLTRAAPGSVQWLREIGACFDMRGDALVLGREAAHSRARIVHAGGDATGAEIMRTLRAAVRCASHIQVFEDSTASTLLSANGAVVGVEIDGREEPQCLAGAAVVLATGGIGALYRYSTNPDSADGSGLALALRAGAELADLEFVQFHPTALAPRIGESGQLPLVTEALRGAGALLLNGAGKRFMLAHSAQAELAPRDVVARAVWQELERSGRVFLDARAAVGAAFPQRFPTVFAACRQRGLDPRAEPIPVVPAEHYLMGGIRVDAQGMSTLPGLYAVGECACSGVHGANRLASNSLLEGLVFGRALGLHLAQTALTAPPRPPRQQVTRSTAPIMPTLAAAVRDCLWQYAALERSEAGLRTALAQIETLQCGIDPQSPAADCLLLATHLVQAARARGASIGAHFRSDAPRTLAAGG